jgi:hypothetical protein
MCIDLGEISGESGSSCSCEANGVTGYTTVENSSFSSGGVGGSGEEEDGSEEIEKEGEGDGDSSSEYTVVVRAKWTRFDIICGREDMMVGVNGRKVLRARN